MPILRVALVQLSAGDDLDANCAQALASIERAAKARPSLVALPETFLYRGRRAGYLASATQIPGPLTDRFAEAARAVGAWLLLGSLVETSTDAQRPYNTSVLIDPAGRVAATYRKRHLFDVDLASGISDRESDRATAGAETVVARMPGVATEAAGGEGAAATPDVLLGLSICFDVRFPELYRDLAARGATVLAVPADFKERTGRDHWEVLLRARAIENEAFVIAPAQYGSASGGVEAYGHSMVVDPWGTVIAQAADGPAIVVADLDLSRVDAMRRQIPSQPPPPSADPRDPRDPRD